MRTIAITAAVILAVCSGFTAGAAQPCRDAKGKFVKCEPAKAPPRCRDIKSKKFAKCSAPNTEPVPMNAP